MLRRFQPVKARFELPGNDITDDTVELGRTLFYEKRLSAGRDHSCNSCHDLAHYGVDGQRTSPGDHGQRGSRNSPTVYNAAGQFTQFWDGRAATVEDQAKEPILDHDEMAMPDGPAVVRRLEQVPAYVALFQRAFPGEPAPVTFDHVARALGAFERTLSTPSRWDRYLEGDREALTRVEEDGLRTFLNVGCMVCHTGSLVGGSMFERAGAVEPWPDQTDKGRETVTKLAADRMMFKVPSLRNVEKTAPYFHDGSAATLPDAVRIMGQRQLGLELSEAEIASIVAWLASLTGEIRPDQSQVPEPM